MEFVVQIGMIFDIEKHPFAYSLSLIDINFVCCAATTFCDFQNQKVLSQYGGKARLDIKEEAEIYVFFKGLAHPPKDSFTRED